MIDDVLAVLKDFDNFEQSLSKKEIIRFARKSVDPNNLTNILSELVSKKYIFKKNERYAIRDTSLKKYRKNYQTAKKLISFSKKYVDFLIKSPFIKGVAISGSVAINDASENDDIDFFIITSEKIVWLARFYSLLLARIFLIWHHKPLNLFCLNLFFESGNLEVPKCKKNLNVAYEIIKLRPLVDKSNTFINFYQQNKWYKQYFPNRQDVINYDNIINDEIIEHGAVMVILKPLNFVFKTAQKLWLKYKEVSFTEHNGQLWLC
jgi:hypothetical protein